MPTTDSARRTSEGSSRKPVKPLSTCNLPLSPNTCTLSGGWEFAEKKPGDPMSQEEMDALYRMYVKEMNAATEGVLYKDFQFSISEEDLRNIRGENGELDRVGREPPAQNFRLWLPGYKPPSQNRLNGNGFRGFNREKNRAHAALSSALRSAAAAPATGTTAGSKDFKTLSSTLEHFLTTHGSMLSKAASGQRKSRPKKMKAP